MDSVPAEPLAPGRNGSGGAPPSTVAIVVSFNSAGDLPACLASLEAQRGVALAIHVVDNASSDGSADLVRRGFPRVRLTANARNVGFARANNLVLGAGGDSAAFYALVNPDTVLPPDAVAACVDYLVRDPSAGVAATRLVNPDGSLQPSCHAFLDIPNLLGEAFGLHRALPGLRIFTSLYMPWFAHDRIAEVDWVQGAFLVVRAEAVRRAGPLDADFFMYGEEMDWCRRIRDAGWRIVFLPEPPVVHVGGASSKPVAGPMFVENLKGRVRYLRKHEGAAAATAARLLLAVTMAVRLAWREAQAGLIRLGGGTLDESLRLKREMIRAAWRWLLKGAPLSPPEPR